MVNDDSLTTHEERKLERYRRELPILEERLKNSHIHFIKQGLRQKIRVRKEALGILPKTLNANRPKKIYTPRGTKVPKSDEIWHYEWPEDCAPLCSVPHDGVTVHFGSNFNVTDNWKYVNCQKCLSMRETLETNPDKLRGRFFELFRREAK